MLYSLAGVGQMQAQESSCTLVLSGHVIDDHDKEALPFAEVYLADDKVFCDTLDKCRDVSLFLLGCASRWLGED